VPRVGTILNWALGNTKEVKKSVLVLENYIILLNEREKNSLEDNTAHCSASMMLWGGDVLWDVMQQSQSWLSSWGKYWILIDRKKSTWEKCLTFCVDYVGIWDFISTPTPDSHPQNCSYASCGEPLYHCITYNLHRFPISKASIVLVTGLWAGLSQTGTCSMRHIPGAIRGTGPFCLPSLWWAGQE
jgi:hypothetical protein